MNEQLLELIKQKVGAEKFEQLKSSVKTHSVFSEIKTVMGNYGLTNDDKRSSANYVLGAIIENFENGDKKICELVAKCVKENYPKKIETKPKTEKTDKKSD